MPDVSKLRLDNVTYDIKDDNARKYLVMVNEEPVSATKMVVETGGDAIELALQSDLDILSANMTAEINARQSTDAALQNSIITEASTRATADTNLSNQIAALQSSVGSPLVASTAAAMTDHSKIYVYTGSESGKTAGHWYYWNGSAWTDGGVYNSTAVNTDKTLTILDAPADAFYTGIVRDNLNSISGGKELINATFSQGSWVGTSFETVYKYRVGMPTPVSYDRDIVISVNDNNYYLRIMFFASASSTPSIEADGMLAYFIPAGQLFAITVINRTNESAHNAANIETYRSVVVFKPIYTDNDTFKRYKNGYEEIKGVFKNGAFMASGFDANYRYRAANPVPIVYDYPVKVTADNGYTFRISYTTAGGTYQRQPASGVTEFVVPANQYFVVTILNSTAESASTKPYLNPEFMRQAIHVTPLMEHRISLLENAAPSVQGALSKGWQSKGLRVDRNDFVPQIVELGTQTFGFVGRWYKKEINGQSYMVTNNDGSLIYFKISGTTTLVINFTSMIDSSSYTTWFAYSIDGSEPVRRAISDNVITLPNTDPHVIKIVTDAIHSHVGKWTDGNGYAFAGVSTTGTITGLMPRAPIINWYGDSITAGMGTLGVVPTDSSDQSVASSASKSYAYVTSEILNAVPSICAYGASGVINQGSFNTTLNSAKYLYNNVPVYTTYPDLIAINSGFNDGTFTSSDFTDAYAALVDWLHGEYPGVIIVCINPFGYNQPRATEIQSVVSTRPWCKYISTSGWTYTTSDGTHPDVAGAESLGIRLAAAIDDIIYESE